MYAVVSTGGKQYRVEPGTTLSVERLAAEPGASITLDRVLLFGDGDDVRVGTPTLDGVTVRATVLSAERGPKLVIFKFKQKAKYRRRTGHRQELTQIRIDAIETAGGTRVPARARRPKPEAASEPADEADAAEAPAKPVRRRRTKAAPAASASSAEAATTPEAPPASEEATAAKPSRPRRPRRSTTKPAAEE